MPTRAFAGLTNDELAGIGESLAAGRKPRVMFTEAAGQIAGQVGQVVSVSSVDGAEAELVVRFAGDELPFTPADVVIAPRGAGRRTPAPTPVVEPAGPPGPELLPPAAPQVPEPRVESVEPVRKAARVAKSKVKAPAGLTVTVAFAEGEWTVSAMQGSRVLAKPCEIRPAEALQLVSALDVPAVQEAVEQIVTAERVRAQERAARLRAELAEVEAQLAELPAGAE